MQMRFFTEFASEDRPERPKETCSYGVDFSAWTSRLCAENRDSIIKINQAKILLIDKYFEWRTYVPRDHRNRVSERSHFCIWHVFEEAYRTLRLAELSLNGPLLFLPPPPPPPPPPPQIAGITIGELVGEE